MKKCYKDWNPRAETLSLVVTAEHIIDEYEAEGYTLTLRQLYYQFVARDLIENSERSYKNLGSAITRARMAGLLSWESIEDRNREHHEYWVEEDEEALLYNLPGYIRFDQWARQDAYVEVWVEKEALGNVVARACNRFMVPHMACKGYLSASEAWRAGRRFKQKLDEGKDCFLLHLGDHDPSGIDMTRDNAERVELFSEAWVDFDAGVEVHRLALNMDQVDEFAPPPNPAKITDSRAKEYIKKYGRTSWELDALEPKVIEELITSNVRKHLDMSVWGEVKALQADKRELLSKLGARWDDVKDLLGS